MACITPSIIPKIVLTMESLGFVDIQKDGDYSGKYLQLAFIKTINNNRIMCISFRDDEIVLMDRLSNKAIFGDYEIKLLFYHNGYSFILDKIQHFIDEYDSILSINKSCKFVSFDDIKTTSEEDGETLFNLSLYKRRDRFEDSSFNYLYSIERGIVREITNKSKG